MVERLQQWNKEAYYPYYLALITLLSSGLLYLPYWQDLSVVPKYWDGPNYMYIAKTLYDIPEGHPFTPYKTTPAYFACHLPLYPLLIRLFAFLGYPFAMILVTLVCAALATVVFYYLLCETNAVKSPFWSALISLFMPVKWMVYRSVGATEPLYMLLIFGSMLFFHRKRYLWAFGLAALASTTRIVGVLMIVVYLIMLIRDKQWKYLPGLLLIPTGLLLTFSFYYVQYHDFWAYFSWNQKLIHGRPLDVLLIYIERGISHSAELYFLIFMIFGAGILLLARIPLFCAYVAVYYSFNVFIYHEDISRYFIPIAPIALVVAYDAVITSDYFRKFSVLLIAMSYVFAWGMLRHNLIVDFIYDVLLQALGA